MQEDEYERIYRSIYQRLTESHRRIPFHDQAKMAKTFISVLILLGSDRALELRFMVIEIEESMISKSSGKMYGNVMRRESIKGQKLSANSRLRMLELKLLAFIRHLKVNKLPGDQTGKKRGNLRKNQQYNGQQNERAQKREDTPKDFLKRDVRCNAFDHKYIDTHRR
jgi:hypothetical protein